ncbi:hypothetical protein ACW95P_01540 [Candidatus Mycoplasma pogonae]
MKKKLKKPLLIPLAGLSIMTVPLFVIAAFPRQAVSTFNNNKAYQDNHHTDLEFRNWMSNLPNEMPIKDLSIPGTHDSGMFSVTGLRGFFGQAWAKTQDRDFTQQFKQGIRALDIRIDENLDVNHGGAYSGWNLNRILWAVRAHLIDNPSEFFVIRIKDENIGDLGNRDKRGGVGKKIYDLLNNGSYSSFLYRPSNSVVGSLNLKVKDLRGKFLIVNNMHHNAWDTGNNYSVNWYSMNTQDEWNLDHWPKFNAIKNHLKNVSDSWTNSPAWNVSFTSRSHSNSQPWATAKSMNPEVLKWLNSDEGMKLTRLGIVFMDYAGDSLVHRVIMNNFYYPDYVVNQGVFGRIIQKNEITLKPMKPNDNKISFTGNTQGFFANVYVNGGLVKSNFQINSNNGEITGITSFNGEENVKVELFKKTPWNPYYNEREYNKLEFSAKVLPDLLFIKRWEDLKTKITNFKNEFSNNTPYLKTKQLLDQEFLNKINTFLESPSKNTTTINSINEMTGKIDKFLENLRKVDNELLKMYDAKNTDNYKLSNYARRNNLDGYITTFENVKNAGISQNRDINGIVYGVAAIIKALNGNTNLASAKNKINDFGSFSSSEKSQAINIISNIDTISNINLLNQKVDAFTRINNKIEDFNRSIDKLDHLDNSTKTYFKLQKPAINLNSFSESTINNSLDNILANAQNLNNKFNELLNKFNEYIVTIGTRKYIFADNLTSNESQLVQKIKAVATNISLSAPLTTTSSIRNGLITTTNASSINDTVSAINTALAGLNGIRNFEIAQNRINGFLNLTNNQKNQATDVISDTAITNTLTSLNQKVESFARINTKIGETKNNIIGLLNLSETTKNYFKEKISNIALKNASESVIISNLTTIFDNAKTLNSKFSDLSNKFNEYKNLLSTPNYKLSDLTNRQETTWIPKVNSVLSNSRLSAPLTTSSTISGVSLATNNVEAVQEAINAIATAITSLNGISNLDAAKRIVNGLNNFSSTQKTSAINIISNINTTNTKLLLDQKVAMFSNINTKIDEIKRAINRLSNLSSDVKRNFENQIANITWGNSDQSAIINSLTTILTNATALNSKFSEIANKFTEYKAVIGTPKHDLSDDLNAKETALAQKIKLVIPSITLSAPITTSSSIAGGLINVTNINTINEAINAITTTINSLNGVTNLETAKTKLNGFSNFTSTQKSNAIAIISNISTINTKALLEQKVTMFSNVNAKMTDVLNGINRFPNLSQATKDHFKKQINDIVWDNSDETTILANLNNILAEASSLNNRFTDLISKFNQYKNTIGTTNHDLSDNILQKETILAQKVNLILSTARLTAPLTKTSAISGSALTANNIGSINDAINAINTAFNELNGNNNLEAAKTKINNLTNFTSAQKNDAIRIISDINIVNSITLLNEKLAMFSNINTKMNEIKSSINNLTYLNKNVSKHFIQQLDNITWQNLPEATIISNLNNSLTNATTLNSKFTILINKFNQYKASIGTLDHDLTDNIIQKETELIQKINVVITNTSLSSPLIKTSTISSGLIVVNQVATVENLINAITSLMNSFNGESKFNQQKATLVNATKRDISNNNLLSNELKSYFNQKLDQIQADTTVRTIEGVNDKINLIKTEVEKLIEKHSELDATIKVFTSAMGSFEYQQSSNQSQQKQNIFNALNTVLALNSSSSVNSVIYNNSNINTLPLKQGVTITTLNAAIQVVKNATKALDGKDVIQSRKQALARQLNQLPLTKINSPIRNELKKIIDIANSEVDFSQLTDKINNAIAIVEKIESKIAELENLKNTVNYKLATTTIQTQFNNSIDSLKNEYNKNLFDNSLIALANNLLNTVNISALNGETNLNEIERKINNFEIIGSELKSKFISSLPKDNFRNLNQVFNEYEKIVDAIKLQVNKIDDFQHLSEPLKAKFKIDLVNNYYDFTKQKATTKASEITSQATKINTKFNELKVAFDNYGKIITSSTITDADKQMNNQKVISALNSVFQNPVADLNQPINDSKFSELVSIAKINQAILDIDIARDSVSDASEIQKIKEVFRRKLGNNNDYSYLPVNIKQEILANLSQIETKEAVAELEVRASLINNQFKIITDKIIELEGLKRSINYKLANDSNKERFDNLIISLKSEANKTLNDDTIITAANNASNSTADNNILNGNANWARANAKIDGFDYLPLETKTKLKSLLSKDNLVDLNAKIKEYEVIIETIKTQLQTIDNLPYLTNELKTQLQNEMIAIDPNLEKDVIISKILSLKNQATNLNNKFNKLKTAFRNYSTASKAANISNAIKIYNDQNVETALNSVLNIKITNINQVIDNAKFSLNATITKIDNAIIEMDISKNAIIQAIEVEKEKIKLQQKLQDSTIWTYLNQNIKAEITNKLNEVTTILEVNDLATKAQMLNQQLKELEDQRIEAEKLRKLEEARQELERQRLLEETKNKAQDANKNQPQSSKTPEPVNPPKESEKTDIADQEIEAKKTVHINKLLDDLKNISTNDSSGGNVTKYINQIDALSHLSQIQRDLLKQKVATISNQNALSDLINNATRLNLEINLLKTKIETAKLISGQKQDSTSKYAFEIAVNKNDFNATIAQAEIALDKMRANPLFSINNNGNLTPTEVGNEIKKSLSSLIASENELLNNFKKTFEDFIDKNSHYLLPNEKMIFQQKIASFNLDTTAEEAKSFLSSIYQKINENLKNKIDKLFNLNVAEKNEVKKHIEPTIVPVINMVDTKINQNIQNFEKAQSSNDIKQNLIDEINKSPLIINTKTDLVNKIKNNDVNKVSVYQKEFIDLMGQLDTLPNVGDETEGMNKNYLWFLILLPLLAIPVAIWFLLFKKKHHKKLK